MAKSETDHNLVGMLMDCCFLCQKKIGFFTIETQKAYQPNKRWFNVGFYDTICGEEATKSLVNPNSMLSAMQP